MMMRHVLGFAYALQIACVHTLPHPTFAPQPPSALIAVPDEPPPALVEIVPPSPDENAVWIDGEWTWSHRRWTWLPGRWVIPPPNATYSQWVTVRASDGSLYFAPATWRDAQGQAIPPPKPLATAAVVAAAVVTEANGETTRITVKSQ